MDMFGIAATSMNMHQTQLAQAVQTSVLKKTMDAQEVQLQEFLEMLPPTPSGHNIDVYA